MAQNDGTDQVWMTLRLRFANKAAAQTRLSVIANSLDLQLVDVAETLDPFSAENTETLTFQVNVGDPLFTHQVGTAHLGTPGGDEFEMEGR